MTNDTLLLGQLAEEFTSRIRSGELPNAEDYAEQHPELAERIRQLFPTLMFLEGMAGNQNLTAPGAAAACHDITPGTLFGSYRIEREIGRGGMGVVYEAVHIALDKHVALKMLPVLGPRETGPLERFLREAKTAAGLHHTNIVPVFDVGQASGVPYYAMQYIAGRGLDRVLRDLSGESVIATPTSPGNASTGNPSTGDAPTLPHVPSSEATVADVATGVPDQLPKPQRVGTADFFVWVAGLGIQAAQGLDYAHQRGVVHRDIKPSNLILDEQAILWITDFGLARRTDDVSMTHTGAVLGTPRYMSPEQAESHRHPVDHRTDIYSLAATLYELLTRRPVFDGQTPQQVLMQILSREPVAPRRLNPAVPRDLETIVLKAMAKRPKTATPQPVNWPTT